MERHLKDRFQLLFPLPERIFPTGQLGLSEDNIIAMSVTTRGTDPKPCLTKIDSLEETCFTCLQTFDNFIELMKHRKASHYDTISECHKFKAGGCQFKERCYYKHTATQNPPDKGQDDSFPQGQEEFPPDLRELTLGFQSLMSTFLSNREKQRSRQSGF